MIDENYEGELYVLQFEDEDGNTQSFVEDVVINYKDQQFAVLAQIPNEDDDHEGQDETYMILARIEVNEQGEEEYVTLDENDEDFDAVVEIYENMELDEEE